MMTPANQVLINHATAAQGGARDEVLRIRDLSVAYGGPLGTPVVRGTSLLVHRGEALGLVGESGSGKSTVASAVTGLLSGKGCVTGGSIAFEGRELTALPEHSWREIRGRRIAMVFQEAATALDPLMTVGAHLREALHVTRGMRRRAATRAALDLVREVRLSDPEQRLGQYPHELSGGMRQRVQIALALAGEPDLLIADEPTTALDVTVQGQILQLLRDRQRARAMTLILISHSLPVVASVVDRVVVLYGGRVMESGPVRELFDAPRHPYTAGLLRANPAVDRDSEIKPLEGAPPTIHAMPPGCPFAPRCGYAEAPCHQSPPPAPTVIAGERVIACPVDPLRER